MAQSSALSYLNLALLGGSSRQGSHLPASFGRQQSSGRSLLQWLPSAVGGSLDLYSLEERQGRHRSVTASNPQL